METYQMVDTLDQSLNNLKGIAAILYKSSLTQEDNDEYIYMQNFYGLIEDILFKTIGEVKNVCDAIECERRG